MSGGIAIAVRDNRTNVEQSHPIVGQVLTIGSDPASSLVLKAVSPHAATLTLASNHVTLEILGDDMVTWQHAYLKRGAKVRVDTQHFSIGPYMLAVDFGGVR